MTLDVVNVGCVPGGEAFLLMTEEKTAIFDAGFSFTAKGMVKKMKAELGERKLDYILLSHSHYDHISGASLMKKVWPEAKIVSAEHAAKVFEKPTAMKTIRRMNRFAASYFKKSQFFSNDLSRIHTDVIVKDGDVIDLGSLKLVTVEAPGHTWDSLAFWCESEGLLMTCETMGVFAGTDSIMPTCLVSYNASMRYIEKMEGMNIRKMLYPHYGIIDGEEACRKVIAMARRDNELCMKIISDAFESGKSEDEIKQIVKDKFYTDIVRTGQPEKAFDLNNKYLVPMMIREYQESKQEKK